MEKYIHALETLGLTDKEARVYLALLELGQASAYSLADKSKIKRPTTYVILAELMKKGLVLKVPRAKKQNYVAVPPQEFFRQQEEKMKQSRAVLPELMEIAGTQQRKVKVTYYEGIRGVEQAMMYGQDRLKNKEVVGFFATAENLAPEFWKACLNWSANFHKNNIRIRGVTPNHPSLIPYKKLSTDYKNNLKYLPLKEYSSKVSIDMGDTYTRIVMNEDLQAVIIENPELTHTLKQIFEMLWKVK